MKDVVVLDHGSGNVRSVVRALEHVGAKVTLSADRQPALDAAGLLVPGVGNFHTCLRGLRAVEGDRIIDVRLAGGRPVLGICVGMQAMFEGSAETSVDGAVEGLGEWPGRVTRLPDSVVVPHMGWSPVEAPDDSVLFADVREELFYFVHSYAAQEWALDPQGSFAAVRPRVTFAEHGARFVAAVENGPLCATQFHPEKSGDAGLHLLESWVATL